MFIMYYTQFWVNPVSNMLSLFRYILFLCLSFWCIFVSVLQLFDVFSALSSAWGCLSLTLTLHSFHCKKTKKEKSFPKGHINIFPMNTDFLPIGSMRPKVTKRMQGNIFSLLKDFILSSACTLNFNKWDEHHKKCWIFLLIEFFSSSSGSVMSV